MEKIAIYGGAFNPPTLGHLYIIEEVLKNTDIKKIIIVPDGYRLDKNYGIDEFDRVNMIYLFKRFVGKKGFDVELDDYFLLGKNEGDTTTYKIDKYFTNKLGFKPYQIFGTDISGGIKEWTGNPNKYVQKKVKKIFVPRKGYKFIKDDLEKYKLIKVEKKSNISSTAVRENIKNKKDISKLVNNNIRKYIKDYKLYK